MTTIAFDGKTLAGDTLGGGGCFLYENGDKLFAHDGAIYGVAGERQAIEIFKEWIFDGAQKDRRPALNEEGCINVLKWDGKTLWCIENRLAAFPVSVPHAIGSGCEKAMGALLAGADAKRSVEIAAQLDPHTGGKITTLPLDDLPPVNT